MTTAAVCTKFPHPDDITAESTHTAQVKRIRTMTAELRRRDTVQYAAARDFARMHLDDLAAVEISLRQTLEGLDAADQMMMENELRNA